jgi:hypothetical protein
MGIWYSRQSSAEIVNGQVINDTDFNNEFDAIVTAFGSAFSATLGHTHTGTAGDGPLIPITGTFGVTGVTGVLASKYGGIWYATTDPTATDDTPDHVKGSRWFNTSTGKLWVCMDNTSTAAVWEQMGDGVSSAALPTVNSDRSAGYNIGHAWVYTGVTPSLVLICIDNTVGAAVWYPVGRGRIGVITGATTIPTTANDSTQGYSQGSIILNSTQGTFYLCTSAAGGAATWVSLATGRTYVSASTPTINDDSTKGYQVGSIGVETGTPIVYVATSVGVGAAVWQPVTFNIGLVAIAAQVFG